MKRLIILTGLFFTIFMTACSEDNSNNTSENTNDINQNEQEENINNQSDNENETDDDSNQQIKGKTLDNLVSHFEENGFEIGDKTEKVAEMVGAVDGFGIELDGEDIELYKYESDSEDLEEIKENEEYDMDGFVFTAISNDNLVLINHDEHSEEDDILKVFEAF